MNIGPFYKDIWSLLFKHFEINFDPYTLNSLSLTCKKLNQIDKEHISSYKNYLKRKYKIREDFFHLFFEKGRCNYIKMDGHISIALTDFTTGKMIEKGSSRSFISVLSKIFDYLDKIEVNTYEEFKNMKLEDL